MKLVACQICKGELFLSEESPLAICNTCIEDGDGEWTEAFCAGCDHDLTSYVSSDEVEILCIECAKPYLQVLQAIIYEIYIHHRRPYQYRDQYRDYVDNCDNIIIGEIKQDLKIYYNEQIHNEFLKLFNP